VFRDETATVIRKNLKQEKLAIPENVVIPIEERAKQMFISQYVFGTSPFLDYMQTFYPSGLQDVHLAETVRAVSLAFLSNEVVSTSILLAARKKYGRALSLTNKALRSAESATKDTTLLTVLLLDLFESLANKSQKPSLESESKHIDGAITLVKLRGNEQFNDSIGLRMFLQLSRNVVINCLWREVEVPPELIFLRSSAAEFVDSSDSKWRFSNTMIQYAKLRAAMRTGELSDDETILFARQIDSELIDIYGIIPPDWQASTTNTETPSTTAPKDYFHVYRSHNTYKAWNVLRIVRILLNEVI
jgi:hypothetical protein